jgi:anti-anti-sigma factor
VNSARAGQSPVVEETTRPASRSGGEASSADEPAVTHFLDGDTAHLTLTRELTEAVRRPLVRVLTDLLLGRPTLNRVELHLQEVAFMNSAGMAVLVQGQRMAAPRGIALVLVDPPTVVSRPLQLSGLWHRFAVLETGDDEPADD